LSVPGKIGFVPSKVEQNGFVFVGGSPHQIKEVRLKMGSFGKNACGASVVEFPGAEAVLVLRYVDALADEAHAFHLQPHPLFETGFEARFDLPAVR
jgi:hypothetical protein